MKKYTFITAVLIFAKSYAQNEFHINARISAIDSGFAYLQYTNDSSTRIIDTLSVTSELHFKGETKEGSRAFLFFSNRKLGTIDFFISKGNTSIDASAEDLGNATIKGTTESEAYEEYQKRKRPIQKNLDSLENLYDKEEEAGNKSALDAIDKEYESVQRRLIPVTKNFITEHPESAAAASLLNDLIRYEALADDLKNLFATLSVEVQKTKRGESILELITNYAKTAVGQPAPSFTQKDTTGKDITFASVKKGKVLLLDFWASWCGPCRKENPNIVTAYEKYHAKGFEILGVSLDKNADKWKAAIQKDRLSWQHVSDLKYWENEVAKLYSIRSIPSNLLINANGIIIAKNLRGEDLHKKLEELLK